MARQLTNKGGPMHLADTRVVHDVELDGSAVEVTDNVHALSVVDIDRR